MAVQINLRPPGVYTEMVNRNHSPILLGPTGIAAFLGFAERGPTDEPCEIHSVSHFDDVFGAGLEKGYLRAGVEAFFENGGRRCRVVRIVHHDDCKANSATKASAIARDRHGRGVFGIEAVSEGAWANDVHIDIRRMGNGARTLISIDGQQGDRSLAVVSGHGFRPLSPVCISDEYSKEIKILSGVNSRKLDLERGNYLGRRFEACGPTRVESIEYEVEVRSPFLTERFSQLFLHDESPRSIARIVTEQSKLVRVFRLHESGEDNSARAVLDADFDVVRLCGGQDAIDLVNPEDFVGASHGVGHATGLACLEGVRDIDLILAPDVMSQMAIESSGEDAGWSIADVEAVYRAMILHCERMGDRLALLDSPYATDVIATRRFRMSFDSSYSAMYFPWVKDATTAKWLPPSGHVAGVYARVDAVSGIQRAPANEPLANVCDVTLTLLDSDISGLVSEGVNCLKSFGSRGIRVWGASTLTAGKTWRFVNVRRVVNAVSRALEDSLQWVVFEPNDPQLWKTISRNIRKFMIELWKQGFFAGDAPQEGFFVKCDAETNPPLEREAGRLNIEVGLAPVSPAEFLIVRISQAMNSGD